MKKLVVFLFLLCMGFNSFAQDAKPIIFIMDASGSMWQKINSDYKIELAREVLRDLTNEMDASQAVGLVAYGHREKGNCDDIETLLSTSNQDKAAFQKAVDELNPTGKTPLARSAQKVIDDLKANGASATIILITDGIETCDGDLCQIVEQAKAAGIDFVLHIIGFDLGDADREPLECAAQAGDGIYVDANDKDELSEALDQATELTVDLPTGLLSVEVRRNEELQDGSIQAYKAGTQDWVAGIRSYSSSKTNPAQLNLPPGTYDIEVMLVGGGRGISPIVREGIVVKESEKQDLLFDFTSGFFNCTVTNNGELHDAGVTMRRLSDNYSAASGRTYTSAKSNPLKKEVAPGWYNVEIKSISIKGNTAKTIVPNVEIKPGETTSIKHAFESATLKVGAKNKGNLWDATVSIASVEPKASVAQGRTYTSSSSNPKTFTLSPGTYKVTVKGLKLDNAKKEFTVTIKPGDEKVEMVEW